MGISPEHLVWEIASGIRGIMFLDRKGLAQTLLRRERILRKPKPCIEQYPTKSEDEKDHEGFD
jgi:hypothetical protein